MSKLKILIVGLAFTLIVVLVGGYVILPVRFYPTNPDDAKIYYSDLHDFAMAHRHARAHQDSASQYSTHYYDTDSKPVRSLVGMVELSAEKTAAHARQYPTTYDVIGERIAAIEFMEPEVRAAFEKLEEIYPDAVYPPVYLAFSGFKARGLIRPYGIITGGEYFISQAGDESLDGWHDGRQLIVAPELLPSQLIHELAHIQQARNHPLTFMNTGNVLNWTIFEGAADFVANAITGAHTNEASHAFLEDKGDALWCVFYDSMNTSRRIHWMDAEVFGVPPGGFGASFGYAIVSAWFDKQTDKSQALIELIELSSYQQIFDDSGYAQLLTELCSKK